VVQGADVKPWLDNPKWTDNRVNSGARTRVYVGWVIAIIWNLISAPFLLVIPDAYAQNGAISLLITEIRMGQL